MIDIMRDSAYNNAVVCDDFVNSKFLATKGCLADLLFNDIDNSKSTIAKSLMVKKFIALSINKATSILTCFYSYLYSTKTFY